MPPHPVFVFSPIRLVVQEPSVGKPTSIQRVHLLMDNPSGPNHRCITRNFNGDLPGWGMASWVGDVFQSHIVETGVYSPASRVLTGLATLSLQPSRFSMIDVAVLYMHHVTVEGVRLPRDYKLAPRSRTSIPRDTAAWKVFQCARYSSSVMK